MVTGGIIAVYLAVQAYTPLPTFTRRAFFAVLALAFVVASFRAWRVELLARLETERTLEQIKQDILLGEDPKVEIAVQWPNDDVNSGPVALVARNKGRLKLLNFRIRDLSLGLVTATFSPLTQLQPDVDSPISVQIPGIQTGADLLDAIMLNYSKEISPVDFLLQAEVEKLNGQLRHLRYTLSYSPLSNPRRTPNALETHRCLTIQRA